VVKPLSIEQSFQELSRFLSGRPLTNVIADLEGALDGTRPGEAMSLVADAGVDAQLLSATVAVRAGVGRLNDLIHAAGIARALPYLLEADETVTNRPSLAAGNDPSRPFDLETDRRICEFKFSRWTGSDAMRKRGVFKDFVELAADTSGRQAYLYVPGGRPGRFLRTTTSKASWAWTALRLPGGSSPSALEH
jgi:hypothetical protein